MPPPPAATRCCRRRACGSDFGSICRRNCPIFTRSPSFTARFTTRPGVSALIFTRRFGWILPDADTTASRSRDLIDVGRDRQPFVLLEVEVRGDDRGADENDTDGDENVLARHLGSCERRFDGGDDEPDRHVDDEQGGGDRAGALAIQNRKTDRQADGPPDHEQIDRSRASAPGTSSRPETAGRRRGSSGSTSFRARSRAAARRAAARRR